MTTEVWIGSAVRTPIGSMLGSLVRKTCVELGAEAIAGAILRSGIPPSHVSETIMGCVLSAGLGQAPARQASLAAGLSNSVPATTVNKMCGSGMKAVMMGSDAIRLGHSNIVVAGGMESMSNAPFFLSKARTGMKYGHDRIFDHMAYDGLEDAYERGKPMGYFAELTAREQKIGRQEQDSFAILSHERARKAELDGHVRREIISVSVPGRGSDVVVNMDEETTRFKPERISTLKPVFMEDGTITAANSSSISDGAAALTLYSNDYLKRSDVAPLARIVSHAVFAQEPKKFTTAPVDAIRLVAEKAGWKLNEVDAFEINEAFAVVAIACARQLSIPHSILNLHGGACALGHPIGASGARIIVTLLNVLKSHGLKRGIASACLGGGEATAIAIELTDNP